MRLESVSIKGFRRFSEQTILHMNGKLTAIVGPNEAGKSSLLDAIYHLNSNDPVDQKDISRGLSLEDFKIEGRYFLTDEELKMAEIDQPTYLVLTKDNRKKRIIAFLPSIRKRSTAHRAILIQAITRALNNKALAALLDINESEIKEKANAVMKILASHKETLSEEEILQISEFETEFDEMGRQLYT